MGCSTTTHMMGERIWFKECHLHAIWSIVLQGLVIWGLGLTRLYIIGMSGNSTFSKELNCSCLGLVRETHNLSFPLEHKCSLFINFDHITHIESLPTTSTHPSSHSLYSALVMIGKSETAPITRAPCRMDDMWTEKTFFFFSSVFMFP